MVAKAINVGDAEVNGAGSSPVVITDKLPAGLRVPSGAKIVSGLLGVGESNESTQRLECKAVGTSEVSCTTTSITVPIKPNGGIELTFPVEVLSGAATGEENTVAVGGGEGSQCEEVAPNTGKFTNLCKEAGVGVPSYEEVHGGPGSGPVEQSLHRAITVKDEETPFGVERYELEPENEDGTPDVQAGSHPFQMTTKLDLNQTIATQEGFLGPERQIASPSLLRNLRLELPVGLIGNPTAVPQCSSLDFTTLGPDNTDRCEPNTAVGVAAVTLSDPLPFVHATVQVPVFNLVPAPGEPARLGFEIAKAEVVLDTSILTDQAYAVSVSVENASEAADVLGSVVTIWGVPGDPVHDQSRGWACLGGTFNLTPKLCSAPTGPRSERPFLTLPTACPGVALQSSVEVQSWLPGASFLEPVSASSLTKPGLETLTGCPQLPFGPEIETTPATSAGNTPAGLKVTVHLPQQTTNEPTGLAESAVRRSKVVLPQGVQLSPSAANGLQACPQAQEPQPGGYQGIGFIGFAKFNADEPTGETPIFTPRFRFAEEENANHETLEPSCPNGSKLGTVRISTPDLPNELTGGVYLAAQNANPFGSPFAIYIAAEEPESHTLVKLAGKITLDQSTGRITTEFDNTPQVPFEDLELELFGGPRASVTTPPTCGPYAAESEFAPWSNPEAPAKPFGPFDIGSGAEGTGCANPLPLAAGFSAGMASTQGGGFGDFELTISRPDADQALTGVSMHLPTGLAAMLSSVELCPEPQASQGACGPESLIGEATATAGLGSEPFTESGGKVFITGPYDGAPFGLSVVIPTRAGPFDFGDVVTRSTLNVDRNDASVTINSPLPTMVNTVTTSTGVPVQLKQIHVVVNRQGFQFNPTNCSPLKITGTLTGSQGGAQPLASNFQATNCAALPFKPTFEARTEAKTSKTSGASLFVRVTSGTGQANIGKTALQLPIALPSRLTTIQKACTAAAFEANPASCPEGSNIGTAMVHTPVLKNPLSGPAYLVSHGAAKFPDVEFVLQGEGITLILDGATDIKKGITYSDFNSLPDAPVSAFETTLPEGPHSALAANGNLCAQSLIMPTTLTGQNGAVVKQQTKIKVTGCPKPLTPLQKLRAAMKACRKHKSRSQRVACERRARRAYEASIKASAKRQKR